MFLYQNRLLKAQMLNGILDAQQRMTDLYSLNLSAVGMQAAFIAGVTYCAINICYIQDEVKGTVLSLLYNICYAISLSCAMIMVSHCILGSMLGPTKSLIGESSDAVHVAVGHMRNEQEWGIIMGGICISMIFIGTAIQLWANYPPVTAGILSVIYFVGFVIFALTGRHTFKIFQMNYEISDFHLAKDRDLEEDMGTLDADMQNLTFKRGFTLLNKDIMNLVDQIRPVTDRGDVIENHYEMLRIKQEERERLAVLQPPTFYPGPFDVLVMGAHSSTNQAYNKHKK